MRNEIEQGYIDQGYRLPEGLTWERVDALREYWGVNPLLVPEVVGSGCIGWGVPFVDGKPMKHPCGGAGRLNGSPSPGNAPTGERPP